MSFLFSNFLRLAALYLFFCVGSQPLQARCLDCHPQVAPPQTHSFLDCQACHDGQDQALKKPEAHQGLIKKPGELQNIDQSCAKSGCHGAQGQAMQNSVMTHPLGMVEITKKAFGEGGKVPHLNHFKAEGAEGYLRKRCGACHLGSELSEPNQPVNKRGGGCLACHLNEQGQGHKSIDIKIDSQRCFGCHARSGRVAMTYAGLAEISPDQAQTMPGVQRLFDGRPIRLMPADIHFTAGLECIDCHTARGVMGGAKPAQRKGEQREINCTDCHASWQKAPFKAQRFGTQLPLLSEQQGQRHLKLKLSKESLTVPVTQKNHGGKEHQRLSCDACHSGWAPQCYGCHISYSQQGKQYDYQLDQVTKGRWEEDSWAFEASLPALGVYNEKIVPMVPGMIASLAVAGQKTIQWNYYSPLSPHSTAKSRSCQSCHASKAALGQFSEAASHSQNKNLISTKSWQGDVLRANSRPLNQKEQQSLTQVGRCLSCHAPQSGFFLKYKQKLKTISRYPKQHQALEY